MKILDFNGLKLFSNKIKEKLTDKQDILVSGDNIATINGASLLEGGNIIIPTSPFTSGTGGDSAVSNVDIGCEASGQGSFATGIYAKAKGQGSIALGRYCEASGKSSVSLGGLLMSIKLTGEANSLTYKVNSPTKFYTKNPEVLIGISIVSAVTDGTNTTLATITESVLLETGELQITTDKTLSSKSINSATYYLSAAKAIGDFAVSIGSAWQASGNYSVVLGRSAAFGQYSTAIGSENAAFGKNSTAIGIRSIAKGVGSVAMGVNCNALNTAAVAIGQQTTASGANSFSTGFFTTASGHNSYSGGGGLWNFYLSGDGTDNSYQITKGSNWQFVEDLEKLPGSMLYNTNTTETTPLAAVIDSYTLGEDGYTITVVLDRSLGTLDDSKFFIPLGKAEGNYSHSQNGGTKASGDYSTSSGMLTIAVGEASSAFGDRTISRGNKSSTFGEHTFTTNSGEFALGVSNISHTGETKDSQTLLSVGIGSESSELDMATRIENQIPFTSMQDGKNALEIMRNGDIWFGEYNNGIKAYDNATKTSPFIEKSSEDSDKVILGDGTLKEISEVGKSYSIATASEDGLMSKGMYSALKDGFITNINNVTANGTYVELIYNFASPNSDGTFEIMEGEGIEIPLATTTTAGVMSAADKQTLEELKQQMSNINLILEYIINS